MAVRKFLFCGEADDWNFARVEVDGLTVFVGVDDLVRIHCGMELLGVETFRE